MYKSGIITFRVEVVEGDVNKVRDIVNSIGFFSAQEIEIACDLVKERIRKGSDSGYEFLFAEDNQQTIACACFGKIQGTECSFDLYWICVHRNFRGRGIGKLLLARTEQLISDMGGCNIYIETSSREQYRPTREFYLACGYNIDAQLQDFYSPGDNKVIFKKVLKG